MIRIKSHIREWVEYSYTIFYELVEYPEDGYNFVCDMHGEINFNNLTPQALEDYQKCESDEYAVIYRGLQRHEQRNHEPAIGICSCGDEVVLESFTNECTGCNREYNSCGQELTERRLVNED
jgi:hypothetical protein